MASTLARAVQAARHHRQGVQVLNAPGALCPPQPGEGDQLRGLGAVPEQPVEEHAEQAVEQRLGQGAEQQQPAPPPGAAHPGDRRLGAPDNIRNVKTVNTAAVRK